MYRGSGGWSPGEKGTGGVRDAGEKRTGSGSSKRAASGIEMQNATLAGGRLFKVEIS